VAPDSVQGQKLMPYFEAAWSPYLEMMQEFVCITVNHAELITSPAYDIGLKRDELVKTNYEKLSKLID
jgi:hypothetical protein